MNKWLLIHSVGGEGWVWAGEGLGSLSSMHGLWGMQLGAVRIIKGHLGESMEGQAYHLILACEV